MTGTGVCGLGRAVPVAPGSCSGQKEAGGVGNGVGFLAGQSGQLWFAGMTRVRELWDALKEETKKKKKKKSYSSRDLDQIGR